MLGEAGGDSAVSGQCANHRGPGSLAALVAEGLCGGGLVQHLGEGNCQVWVQSKNSSFTPGALQLCLVGPGKHRGNPECWGFDLQQGFAPNSAEACCIGLFRFICALLRMAFLELNLMSAGSTQAGSRLIKCLYSKTPCFAELVTALSNILPLKPYFTFSYYS